MPVLRGERGQDTPRDAAARRSVAGARRPEPLPGVRAPGGRRAHASPCALSRGARRRRADLRRRGVAAPARSRAGGLPPRAGERGSRGGLELAAHALAARLAAGAAARDTASCRQGTLDPRRGARRARARLPVREPSAVRARHRSGGAARGRVRGRAAAGRAAATRRGDPPCARCRGRGAAQRVVARLRRLAFRALAAFVDPRRRGARRRLVDQRPRTRGRCGCATGARSS